MKFTSRLAVPSALFITFILAGCTKKEAPVNAAAKAPEPLSVQIAKVSTRRVERTISVTGELQPDETVSASFEVGGRVSSIRFDFGQFVKKGDIVAELDPREYQIQLDRARAMLAQALARVGLNPDQADVTPTTSPAIRQAEAQLADAKSKYNSASKLIKTGDIANERFVELEKMMQARQAALDAAKDELRTLSANVQSLKADVKLAEKRLSDTVVRAPFNGAIAEKMVSPGQYIKENTPVVRVVKSDPLRLRFDVPESAAGSVRIGSMLTFTTDAAQDQRFTATVRELNPSLNQNSRTLTAEARISNPKWQLKPGTFVQVRLITERDVDITTVPKKSLYNVAGLTKVFTIQDGKAYEHRIPPGMEGSDWVEVPAGKIQPGQQVAISNLGALVNELPVKAK